MHYIEAEKKMVRASKWNSASIPEINEKLLPCTWIEWYSQLVQLKKLKHFDAREKKRIFPQDNEIRGKFHLNLIRLESNSFCKNKLSFFDLILLVQLS